MGLDNGICIKRNSFEPNAAYKKYFIEPYYDNPDWDHIELCYWRKCWNVRRLILNIVNPDGEDLCRYPINANHVDKLIRALFSVFDKRRWERGESIWSFKEIGATLALQIANLKLLKKAFEENPNLNVYFYDSY